MAATSGQVRLPPGSMPLVTVCSTLKVPTPSADPNDPLILFILFTFFHEETKYIPISIESTENVSVNQDSLERLDKNSQPDAKAAQSAADLEYNSSPVTVPLPNSYRQRMRFLTRTEEPLWRNYTTPLKIGMFPHVLYTEIQCANCVLFLVLLSTINSIAFSKPPYNFNTALALLFISLMVWGRRIRAAMAPKYDALLAQVGGVNRA
ncbi:hypothetical protein MRS44_014529 [Fusarium solani]|uniref:uncharacterized protein n=1 Tax=Fusarium solani TaxID=169388 RepID=UPI0032C3D911|nr:hypothetical protein MRS44_014529 [Fusarium solani]